MSSRVGMILFSRLFLLLGLFHFNEAIRADFLRFERRFDDSSTFDAYYCCNLCDDFLIWVVNNKDVVTHYASETTVGGILNVPTDTSNVENIEFSSTIVSLRRNNSGACMDVIFIATQTNPNWNPVVICRGSREQRNISINEPEEMETSGVWTERLLNESRSHGNVTAKLVGIGANIVSIGSNYVTGAITCRSRSGSLSWFVNDFEFHSFGSLDFPGQSFEVRNEQNRDVIFLQAIVLQKNAQEIASVIIGTGHRSQSINVSCISDSSRASFMLSDITVPVQGSNSVPTPMPDQGNASVTTTVLNQGNTLAGDNSLTDGSISLTSCLTSIVMSVGIAMWSRK